MRKSTPLFHSIIVPLLSALVTLFAFLPTGLAASPAPSSLPETPSTWQLLTQSPVPLVIAIPLILVGLCGTIVVLRLMPMKKG